MISFDGKIKNFTPDNDENTLYINTTYDDISVQDLIDDIKDHFGEGCSLDQVSIQAEHIHTRCLGYDLHDPLDWDDYLVIRRS